jgi:rhodanese-related sulfurtransferase
MNLIEKTSRDFLRAVLLALLISSSLVFTSCGGGKTSSQSTGAVEDALTTRAQEVFASVPGTDSEYPGNMIAADELYAKLQDPAEAAKLSLLDTRPAIEVSTQGSIQGSIWIKMQDIANTESLAKLPKDKLIVCISPTGHTANQVAATLRWLGYDAILLKYGMGSWTQTPAGADVTAADARRAIEFPYPVVDVGGASLADLYIPTRAGFTPPPGDAYDVLQSAAQALMSNNVLEQEYPFNHISAQTLQDRLADPVLKGETFLLDIRDPAVYARLGHIEGAVNIPWRLLGYPDNMDKLPLDKLVVVVGDNGRDGGQVTPILKMLGYNAVTLRTGMAGWSPTPETQQIIDAVAAANYPVVTS